MQVLVRTALGAILLLAAGWAHADPVRTPEVEAELIAENTALTPGQNWVALRLMPNPGWHVYWRNPGDSGIPTKLEWTLPPTITAGDIQWPYPHMQSLGDLTNYGYSEQTLHLVPLTVDKDAREGDVDLKAQASWLACKDICVPGKADLQLTLPIAPTADKNPDWAPDFAKARQQLPQPGDDWRSAFAVEDNQLALKLSATALKGADKIQFFPYASDLVNHAAKQDIVHDDADSIRMAQAVSPYFIDTPDHVDGVVTVTKGGVTTAYEVDVKPGEVVLPKGAGLQAAPASDIDHAPVASGPPPTFALVLVFAMLGGLVLNLMPCVFPVLSLKALSLAKSGGDDGGAERRRQTYAYSAGVILSFVGAAALMIGLREAGAAIGWGFQLQSPVFVSLLAYVMFALALSLSGAAEFGVSLMNMGSSLTQKPGLAGSFFTGVLAVVVASPCTAPFMGTALGYAMTQPAYVALSVFAALGFGLALPFLLIGWFPVLGRWLPRPGAWMETFKQVMAFPLYLTVVWLLWVLVRQTNAEMLARVMVGMVLIAFALWLWSRRGPMASLTKLGSLAAAVALIYIAPATSLAKSENTAYVTEAWSPERVAELRADGRTVFVDFTADWCLSCKVNERVALRTDRVEQAFQQRDVAVLVGDWTRSDPQITEELARFGRNGVPLYLVYRGDGEPQILPQLLTPDIVVKAIGGS